MSTVDRRERSKIPGNEKCNTTHHYSPERGEGLCITENSFALFRNREKLSQPRHGCDKLDTDSNECRSAQKEQNGKRCRKPGGECGEGIDQNTPRQDTAPPEPVSQIPAEQYENATSQCRDIKEEVTPGGKLGGAEFQ